MTSETAIWIRKFVDTHQTDIDKKCKRAKEKMQRLQNDDIEMDYTFFNKLLRTSLYHQAQLDLLKVLNFTTINH